MFLGFLPKTISEGEKPVDQQGNERITDKAKGINSVQSKPLSAALANRGFKVPWNLSRTPLPWGL